VLKNEVWKLVVGPRRKRRGEMTRDRRREKREREERPSSS